MKKIIYLFFTISIFVFSHGAEKKDLPGAWKLVESSWNGQFFDIKNPSPIKVYTEGYVDGNYDGTYFVSFYNQKGEAGFNQGFYKLDNGTLVEYINNSTDSNSLNNKFSFIQISWETRCPLFRLLNIPMEMFYLKDGKDYLAK